ncbi:MAG: DUF2141 domain-containing protein [Pseudomonadota bacterium]
MTFKTTLIAGLCAFGLAPSAFAGTLSVTIDGVQQKGGDLYITVQTEDQFLENEAAGARVIEIAQDTNTSIKPTKEHSELFQKVSFIGSSVTDVRSQSYSVGFDLPEGEYSVSFWHDINGNGIFDTDEVGRPIDGWAMSNDDTLRQRPVFADVKVELNSVATLVIETMQYPQ